MVSELISLAPAAIDLIAGIFGKTESEKMADEIRKQQQQLPAQVVAAQKSAEKMSYLGMPGYETYKEQINELMPTTLNQVKEYAQSPSAVIDMASKSLAQTNRAYNDLAIKDATAKISNQRNYQDVLMQAGGMQAMIDRGNIQTNLAATAQEAQGTKDLMQGLTNAAASGINTFATVKGLNYQEQMLNQMGEYWKQTPTNAINQLVQPRVPTVAGFDDATQQQEVTDFYSAFINSILGNKI